MNGYSNQQTHFAPVFFKCQKGYAVSHVVYSYHYTLYPVNFSPFFLLIWHNKMNKSVPLKKKIIASTLQIN